jgi:two-component system chemotaxis response regulator CheB
MAHVSDMRIVVIGASAGGVEALTTLVERLPVDFAAPILIVLHVAPGSPALLPQILNRRSKLLAVRADDGDLLQPGTMYIAPPDLHLLVDEDGRIRLSRGPRENRHRPAIDPLFRSAAVLFGANAIGVVLTGNLDDGTAGLIAIKRRGGITVVQDPEEAAYPAMPRSAIQNCAIDHIAGIERIAELLPKLVGSSAPERVSPAASAEPQMLLEVKMAGMESAALRSDERPGVPSPFSCPQCKGVLWEVTEDDFTRFRCRVGHAYSPESMAGAQMEALEDALWTAMKTLEESARLSSRLAERERTRGHEWMSARFEEREQQARDRADIIRKFIITQMTGTVDAEQQNATGTNGGTIGP